ncbi:cytochrome c biogenesis protein CcsA [Sinomicrobium weinanense]|uniref:Cytochrome c biogenesis protein CcsA n=1 Tax=Sinomicrobium weinanense TaxID=2842200 RepID=A0A926Q4J9_9FLAO|nr:cytochrome c biogenesis protein CcsA [Sinomicrobium weinanense]MBC9796975.1 cytochrome c biogenesis protein CcsA [Sinomicrobium weinanense]MBU3122186.1 cytochrome c biogenesis protein CcsA [Sinomicrobium weinanense]
MTNFLKNTIFSTRLMAVLFLVFATALAFGTFFETWYSTTTARIWVYNAWWFEAIMLLFVINFCGNIVRYQLHKKEKWAVLLLHLSFIFIIAGAFVTRYISYEGVMPIREGEASNTFLSDKTYLTAYIDGEIDGQPMRKSMKDDILVSPEGIQSRLPWRSDFNGQPFTISHVGYISGAEKGLVPDENGEEYLKIVEAGGGTRHDHYIKNGEVTSIHNVLFALNKPTQGAININTKDSLYTIDTPFEGTFMRMADQHRGEVVKDSVQPLQLRSLYNVANMQFVFPDPVVKGKYEVVEAEDKQNAAQDALILDVSTNGETKRVKVLGGKGIASQPVQLSLGGLDFHLSFGSVEIELPFSIKLNDFIAEKYPGTENGYSSFMSKVTVNDDKPFDYDIYMNHILDHKGYRFFQAQFDPDEKGTVLSVNHDFYGTWITYIGYTLLYIGLLGIMFYGKTRFKNLGQMLKKVKTEKAKLATTVMLFFSLTTFAQFDQYNKTDSIHVQEEEHTHTNVLPSRQQIDSIIEATSVSQEHADKFGKLVIQDDGGRMKPVNTFASELLRKISQKDTYNGLDADQVFLSMLQNPAAWYNTELIYMKKHNDSLHRLIGVEEGKKYVRAIDFFDEQGNYKLAPYLREAYATNIPNKFQTEFKEADQRLALLNRALGGEILKIFPVPDDENHKWISAVDYRTRKYPIQDSLYANFIDKSVSLYLMSLQQAKHTQDYSDADKILQAFKKNQENYGSEVLPSDTKIAVEAAYNKVNIFEQLLMWYMTIGLLMFLFIVLKIFYDNKVLKRLVLISTVTIVILFVLHTIGLIARSYISGHAPWSDAYESMIYVAWATMLFGLVFGRKSSLTIASTAFVTSIVLWAAHMNWLDPAIANLQPVLDSYWLMIHVSIIVGSYGPLTLGMILGVVALLLIILTNKKNKQKMALHIREITIINEMALTVGLIMLTIGNFLGGQWANESWGRYWGWDPKETWALVSIMVYAFIVHMRLVPGLRGRFAFNFASIVAYGSIMMTYFGVNFYLVGLHSYASGDKVITPDFVYYSVVVVALLGAVSYWRYRVYYKDGNGNGNNGNKKKVSA